MADPQQVYNEGNDKDRDRVRLIWPDLAAALAAARDAGIEARPTVCAFGHQATATGRTTLNGHPGCPEHIKTQSTRPGGYPLERVDPREWDR